MAFIYDLTDTWNAGGTTFNAIKMNVTDTASAAASKLVTLQVGGSERFGVDKTGIASFAGVVRGPAGTTSAPAFSVTGDTNTGMWFPAADTIAFSEGGVEAMRLDSAGRVAIGTTTPNAAAQLEVASTTRAFLPPRMTTAQRDAIASPPDGSVLYNSTIGALEVRQGGAWVNPTTAGQVNTPPSLETDFQNEFYTSRRTARTFSQLINFTRTTAATFVGSNGLIQTTPQSRNLLTFTQEFDNAAWVKSSATVAANSVAAPDGTMTADTLTPNTTGGVGHWAFQNVTTAATPYTASVYFKAAGYNFGFIRLRNSASTDLYAWFNLSTGSTGTAQAGLTTTIQDAGGGWYRCTATIASPLVGSNPMLFGASNVDNVFAFAGDGTSGIYVWGAQLEQASAATDYTRNFGGLFPPRFDYDPVTLAPRGLLIEEQRTNRTLQSEDFTAAAWVAATSGTSTRVNDGAPLGFTRGLITATSANGGIRQVHSGLTSGQVYALSFYIQSTATSVQIVFENGTAQFGSGHNVTINPSNGTAGVLTGFTSVSIQPFGPGYVYTLITAPAGGALAANIEWRITNSGNSIWLGRPQFEAGAFATSYIPTVASQVTRAADTAAIQAPNFASWYNSSQGTLLVEASCFGLGKSLSDGFVAATNGTAAENISIFRTGSANNVQSSIRDNNADQVTYTVALGTQPVKAALAYATNNSNSAQGGVAQTTDTTCTIPTVDRLLIGSIYAAGDYPTNGHIRSIRYYPTRLQNSQLQALTA